MNYSLNIAGQFEVEWQTTKTIKFSLKTNIIITQNTFWKAEGEEVENQEHGLSAK